MLGLLSRLVRRRQRGPETPAASKTTTPSEAERRLTARALADAIERAVELGLWEHAERVATTAAHARPADQQVEQSAKLPQPVVAIPARPAADPPHRRKDSRRVGRKLDFPRVDQARSDPDSSEGGRRRSRRGECIGPAGLGELPVLVLESAGDRRGGDRSRRTSIFNHHQRKNTGSTD